MNGAGVNAVSQRSTGPTKTFIRFLARPEPQFWLCRVRTDYTSEVGKALTTHLFETAPRFVRPYADLFVREHAGAPLLVKRIRARKEADYVRRYFGSQARREFQGGVLLSRTGVKCPEPIGYALNLLPWAKTDSLYFCRFVPGAVPLAGLLETSEGGRQAESLWAAAASDLRRMVDHGIFHKDAHAGNVLVLPGQERLCWIDNDVTTISDRASAQERLLRRWFQKSGGSAAERAIFEAQFAPLLDAHQRA